MPSIYIPSKSPEDWQKLLAGPDKQWRTGFSAKATAYSWQLAEGFPREINALFSNSGIQAFHEVQLLLAIPEYQVALPPAQGHPSQNDVFALAKATDGSLISITVEAKVSESFDKTVSEWIKDRTTGKIERLEFLKSKLGVQGKDVDSIRYQLLHRLASAILEAERFCARYAVMIVHSFSQTDEWFQDFASFLSLYDAEAEVGRLDYLDDLNDISIYAGWVRGDKKYLAS